MSRPTFWFRSDWVNPFRGHYNWLDFCLVQASGEYDCRFGNIEFHIALLGFHFGGQWHIADGDLELQADLQRVIREWEAHEIDGWGGEPQGREHAP